MINPIKHRNVATEALGNNQCILSQIAIDAVKTQYSVQPERIKMDRQSHPITYSVIKCDEGRFFALYEGKQRILGEGGFGKVKLAQDLDNKN